MTDAPRLPWEFVSPIRTDRLVLRLMTAEDVPDVYAYQSREDVCRYLLFERMQLLPKLNGDIVPPTERTLFMLDRQLPDMDGFLTAEQLRRVVHR